MFDTTTTRMYRLVQSGLVAAPVALAVTLMSGVAKADPKPKEHTLTIAVSQAVDSLGPFKAVRRISTTIGSLMYDYLTAYDTKTGKTAPGLTESWQTSSDGLTWTYKIRDTTGPTGNRSRPRMRGGPSIR